MNEIYASKELIVNFISIILIIGIIYTILSFRKKITQLKRMEELKQKEFTSDEKEFISNSFEGAKIQFIKIENFNKMVYPIFILIAGILFAFLELEEAFIYANIIVVLFIYLNVYKINLKNYYAILERLKKESKWN